MGINKKTQEHHLDEGHNHGQSRHNAQDAGQGSGHSGHEGHGDHEQMFQNRFWVCMALSIPVLLYSSSIQEWLGFNMPAFPGSQWIFPIFSVIIFLYGGLPFLRMAVDELREGQPGMMTLISLAISVAFVYSLTTLVVISGSSFFWELVTLIDVMLLGHWIEMRSVRRASRALDELAELMPDTAERILDDGATREVSIRELHVDDLVLVRPGAGIPADGKVEEGESDTNEAMLTGESKPVRKKPGDEVIAGTINVVYLVQDEQVVGAFALADVIRPESKQAVRRLHDMGMQVAMVGDGVNDAPALTRADVGVAIGSGTDVAVESAGIILVKSNPLDVVKTVKLSRASYRKMKENLAWATGYNVVALPLAAGILAPFGILLSPAVGALIMSISTVVVAVNAQLLRQVDLGA